MSPEHERLRALWLSQAPARSNALVAWVRLDKQVECSASTLREWLAGRLPAHMLPTHIEMVDELPRTPAGKINRLALSMPTEKSLSNRTIVAPATPTESRLARLFEQVLQVRPISVDSDFFSELGGHSLLATQLCSLVRHEWPIVFELRAVFEHSTVADLANYIDEVAERGEARRVIPRRTDPVSNTLANGTTEISKRHPAR